MQYEHRHITGIKSALQSYIVNPLSSWLQLAPVEYILFEAFEELESIENGQTIHWFALKHDGRKLIPELIDHLVVFVCAARRAVTHSPAFSQYFEQFDPDEFREALEAFLSDEVEKPEQIGRELHLHFRRLLVANTQFILEVECLEAEKNAMAVLERDAEDRLWMERLRGTVDQADDDLGSKSPEDDVDEPPDDEWSHWDSCAKWASRFGKSQSWLRDKVRTTWSPERAERNGPKGPIRFRRSLLREFNITNADK